MSSTSRRMRRHHKHPVGRARTAPRRWPWLLAAAAGLALVAGAVGAGLATEESPAPVLAEPTGEVSEMGMPVVATQGAASGTAAAAGITVEGASWSLGQVPLDVAVRPTWTLRNTGDEPVAVGEPHPEVVAGCCPGAYTLGARTLEPGGSTTLSFELSMHQGMDGWHDILSHVPVSAEGGESGVLTLGVTGDFRN
jgi:hypothetical protein